MPEPEAENERKEREHADLARVAPWRFRPENDPRNVGDAEEDRVDWEDNAASNVMAWTSHKVLPNFCQTDDHWTGKLAKVFFTTCPCCMLWRGITIGFLPGLLATIVVLLTAIVRG